MDDIPAASTAGAVLFDLFGTVIRMPSQHTTLQRRRTLARDLRCYPTQFLSAYERTKRDRLRGRLGSSAQMLANMAALAGGEPNQIHIDIAAQRLGRWTCDDLTVAPDMAALLAKLRAQGWRLGLVSDCEIEVAEAIAGLELGSLFDAFTLSCLTGDCKPSPAQFLHCTDQLNVAVEDCVFVGDGGSNELDGAHTIGARPIHLSIPELNPTRAYGSWPGKSAKTIAQLEHQLLGRSKYD